MTPLEMARTRLEFVSGAVADCAPRVRKRRLPKELRNLSLSADLTLRLSRSKSNSDYCLMAAAILNANDIAMQVDASAREKIATLINGQVRNSALRLRALSRPGTGADADEILEKMSADKELCSRHWLDDLPAEVSKFAEAQVVRSTDPFLGPAISKAIELSENG